MVPPQESPTFQAVSSATPNSSIFGWPLEITSNASVTTAPSTQPPDTLPTSYYRAASNYALLLVGDPRVEPRLDDGGANAAYDARRAVHLLAVPVKGPDDGDGGVRAR